MQLQLDRSANANSNISEIPEFKDITTPVTMKYPEVSQVSLEEMDWNATDVGIKFMLDHFVERNVGSIYLCNSAL